MPAALLALLALGACKREDMYTQGKSQTWDRTDFLPKGSTMQPPVPGTVSPEDANQPVPQPARADLAMLTRGHQRFDIYCAPCHGRAGDGEGMIVSRGFPRPPSFHTPALRQAKAGLFYDAITNGYGVMYSYADRVSPADRWAVIAYVRALQRSQYADTASLPPEDRAQLGAGP